MGLDGGWAFGTIAILTKELQRCCEGMQGMDVAAFLNAQKVIEVAREYLRIHPDPEGCLEMYNLVVQSSKRIDRQKAHRLRRNEPDVLHIAEVSVRRLGESLRTLIRPGT